MNGILNSSSLEGYQKCTTLLVSNNKEVTMYVLHNDLEAQKLCLFLARFYCSGKRIKDEKG
jgi:hypothetical protein